MGGPSNSLQTKFQSSKAKGHICKDNVQKVKITYYSGGGPSTLLGQTIICKQDFKIKGNNCKEKGQKVKITLYSVWFVSFSGSNPVGLYRIFTMCWLVSQRLKGVPNISKLHY